MSIWVARHREIIFGVVECVDAVERLPLLDAVTELLEDFDACSLVDRGARRSGEAVEVQAIDA